MSSREMSQRPQGDSGAGAFVPTYHREMLMDRPRVRAFQKAIERLGGADKTFIEFGPGTGVLSAFAARHFDQRGELLQDVEATNLGGDTRFPAAPGAVVVVVVAALALLERVVSRTRPGELVRQLRHRSAFYASVAPWRRARLSSSARAVRQS